MHLEVNPNKKLLWDVFVVGLAQLCFGGRARSISDPQV